MAEALDPKKTYSLQPVRSYEVPGGPYAKNLGDVNIKVLADVRREDAGNGRD